ncbi:MAG: PPC domain-containing protein, partial [Gemmatimonadetes bacterium]|nr:PPC domain-containing protein [Gemmatimonadota bacterium]
DFDAYLTVLGPGLDEGLVDDDGAGRCDSRITLTFPESGEYRVVSSVFGSGTGSFTLIASETPGPASPESCIPASTIVDEYIVDEYEEGSLEDVAMVGTLPMGGFVNGAMSDDDGRFRDRPLQGWTLEGRVGARVAVTLRANDFDPYLFFDGPGFSEPLSDDDSAGELNSRICVELPETGAYRVFAGAYGTAEAGATYRLEAADEGVEDDCGQFTISPDVVADALMSLDPEGRTIGLDELQEGVLTDRDPRHPEAGRRIQPWRLRGPAEASVVVDVVSDAFDAVLYASGEGLDEVLYVDDYGEGCNSRLELVLPPSGEVMLFPGALYEAGEGPYLLRVSIDPPPLEVGGCVGPGSESSGYVADPQDLSGLTGSVGDLPRGAEVEGALGPGDDVLGTGAFGQGWSYEGRAGDELAFELVSDAFDALLYLMGPGLSSPLVDDDGAGNLNSRIEVTLPEDGRYTLVVSTLEAGSEGDFRVRAFRRVVR